LTFLHNHAGATVACAFFVVVAVTFRRLYVFVVIAHGSRRLVRVAAAQPAGQCDLRTSDRNDSTRVPGLVDTVIGVAAAMGGLHE